MFATVLHHFAFPPTTYTSSNFPISLPTFTISSLFGDFFVFDSSHLNGCEMLPHCGFDLHSLMITHPSSAQSCPTLCDSLDYSPPGSSVHGISRARILEWLPFPPPGHLPDQGLHLHLLHCRGILYHLSYTEQIFMCIIATFVFSLEKYLYTFSVHFLVGLSSATVEL